jgi:hypothetical protein
MIHGVRLLSFSTLLLSLGFLFGTLLGLPRPLSELRLPYYALRSWRCILICLYFRACSALCSADLGGVAERRCQGT